MKTGSQANRSNCVKRMNQARCSAIKRGRWVVLAVRLGKKVLV